MKMLIVEDDPSSVLFFSIEAKAQKWDCTDYGLSLPAEANELHRFLRTVCEVRPDVVIIDIALSHEEEALMDDVSLVNSKVHEDMFSGFKYCRALVAEHWNIPIIFLTKSDSANVTRAAIKAGAGLVLVKDTPAGDLLRDVTAHVRLRAAHDPEFFWQLSDAMSAKTGMWQSNIIEKAMNRFFLNQSSVRRFGLLTASLRGILSPLFQGNVDAEKKLMLSLVKSQVLLSLVDPRLRDHVKHTGNVFWVGYRLLHEIPEFKEPQLLSDHIPALYNSPGPLTPRDQLLYAWTLAALFHDFGYVDERQNQLTGLVKSLVPSISLAQSEVRNEETWKPNMQLMRGFVSEILGPNHFLYHFIDNVMTSFGNTIEGNKLIDHGFISAHRLLDMVPLAKLDDQKRKIVLHAAIAIAYHNYVEILQKFKLEIKCKGKLKIGELPICSLLAFCDNIQTWDRESEVDPALPRAEVFDGLLARLVLSDTSYVSGSEICTFSTTRWMDDNGSDINLSLRYFVEAAGGVQDVCENLDNEIQRWIDSGRLRDVCEATGMSTIVHGQIVYKIPLMDNRIVDF
jgi:DNA-binding NarL/FixJ family response regulator